jgi:phosphoribosyl 1,2-cyclic phosphate phosphodiesterase
MKIRFLGTAAAEGIPALYCACDTCKRAWERGGKNFRTRSQALVDDELLIDLGPDTFIHSLQYGVDLTAIRHCLVSHPHSDHFYASDLGFIRKGYSAPPKDWKLRIYSGSETVDAVNKCAEGSGDQLEGIALQPFTPTQVGRYTVTALNARHGTHHPLVYVISDGSRTLLYGHDTDVFFEETWQYLAASGLKLDLVTMDCTGGAHEDLPYRGHMCLGRNIEFRSRLLACGVASPSTQFVCNHFSHNGLLACYDDFAPLAAKEGFLTSFDGMEITF